MVGFGNFGTISNTCTITNPQTIRQNVHRRVIKPGVNCHGTKYYIAVKNAGSGSDRFTVQLTPVSGPADHFIVKTFLGAKPSESVDVTAAVGAGTFATSTMASGAVTSDTTMLRVEVCADKTVAFKGDQATFCLTFTSDGDPGRQDTVLITTLAK